MNETLRLPAAQQSREGEKQAFIVEQSGEASAISGLVWRGAARRAKPEEVVAAAKTPVKVFQFHFHFQLNCNTTKPPLILTLSILMGSSNQLVRQEDILDISSLGQGHG
jgi:hypothetical protein